MGADIMRIVASSLMFRYEPHEPQIDAMVRMLTESVKIAADHGVVLAIENHIDYTSAEIMQILERVGSDALKVNFDTGNTLRMMEDPVRRHGGWAPTPWPRTPRTWTPAATCGRRSGTSSPPCPSAPA